MRTVRAGVGASRASETGPSGPRFAFYGRDSTEDFQDRRQLDAHWTHERPGYRCRHGRLASTARVGKARNVYVREEQALLFLTAHVAALRELIGQHDVLNQRITEYLTIHEVAIRCGYYTWQLEVDGVPIADGWPPHIARLDNGRRWRRKAQDTAR